MASVAMDVKLHLGRRKRSGTLLVLYWARSLETDHRLVQQTTNCRHLFRLSHQILGCSPPDVRRSGSLHTVVTLTKNGNASMPDVRKTSRACGNLILRRPSGYLAIGREELPTFPRRTRLMVHPFPTTVAGTQAPYRARYAISVTPCKDQVDRIEVEMIVMRVSKASQAGEGRGHYLCNSATQPTSAILSRIEHQEMPMGVHTILCQ